MSQLRPPQDRELMNERLSAIEEGDEYLYDDRREDIDPDDDDFNEYWFNEDADRDDEDQEFWSASM